MTKQEAIEYIVKHALPHRLVYECLKSFEDDPALLYKPNNYWTIANDALYEWDI